MMFMRADAQLPSRLRQTGLSLVELGVAMAIVGVIGIITWRWVADTRAPMDRTAIMGQLTEAQAAVEGFVLANHRLPCAASGTNGTEDCGNTSAAAVLLPWRTLGLPSRLGQLHYGVNRGASLDLASAPTASASPDLNINYTPAIPVLALSTDAGVNAAAAALTGTITAANGRRAVINGLDWCRVVRRLAANPTAAGVLTAGNLTASIPVAFVIAHPGVNGVFEGSNVPGGAAGFRFDMPGRAQDSNFDDLSVAVGAGDLASRIGCVSRLGAMQAAAQGAYTAYDNVRVVQEYWSLRVFDIEQAQSALEAAQTGVIMATMNAALAAGSAALAIASAANTEGITIFGLVLSVANVAAAAVELGFAADDLREAEKALQDSKDKELASRAYVIEVFETFTQALTAANRLDEKGLNP